MDWAAYLKHLQTIVRGFNADMVISEPVPISLFYNSLWLSIHILAKQNGCQTDTYKQAIKKTIIAETKITPNLLS